LRASEIRDGMRIDWDCEIKMSDGLVLKADVFRPINEGQYPVIMTHGPYAKGLAFQEGYPSAWNRMVDEHPDVAAGSSNLYQNWEVADPEKWVPDGYVCLRVDSRGCGASPGYVDIFLLGKLKILLNALIGRAYSHGATVKLALTVFPTMVSMPGRLLRCNLSILLQSVSGRGLPTGTVI